MRLLARAGIFSVKEIEGKSANGAYKSYVISKSRKDEKTGEWSDDSIFVKTGELAIIGELALSAFTNLVRENADAANVKQATGVDF